MRILDRYVIREVLVPFVIGLLVFTFMLIIPFLIDYAESFISKGVPVLVVLRVMATLLPGALALTIPMSLLLGLLVAFGRLSADREFVAMQACGVSRLRLLRPVGVLSVPGTPKNTEIHIMLTFNMASGLRRGPGPSAAFRRELHISAQKPCSLAEGLLAWFQSGRATGALRRS